MQDVKLPGVLDSIDARLTSDDAGTQHPTGSRVLRAGQVHSLLRTESGYGGCWRRLPRACRRSVRLHGRRAGARSASLRYLLAACQISTKSRFWRRYARGLVSFVSSKGANRSSDLERMRREFIFGIPKCIPTERPSLESANLICGSWRDTTRSSVFWLTMGLRRCLCIWRLRGGFSKCPNGKGRAVQSATAFGE